MLVINYRTDDWKRFPDGYWYYTHVLHADEKTIEPLMESFYLSEHAGNPYRKKDARILVEMEGIQAAGGASEDHWGITGEDLGITYFPYEYEAATYVNIDAAGQIVFDAGQGNLFADFQELVPGCTRSQTVRVTNQWKNPVHLYLRAEEAGQNASNGEELRLIQKLLTEYAKIQIRSGEKLIYSGTVDGNLSGGSGPMKENIDLGVFAPGEGQKLSVSLTLDSEMDLSYQKLLGKVDWIFTAQEEEKPDESTGNHTGTPDSGGDSPENHEKMTSAVVSPKTGDNSHILEAWILMAAGLSGGILSCCKIYGKQGKDRRKSGRKGLRK